MCWSYKHAAQNMQKDSHDLNLSLSQIIIFPRTYFWIFTSVLPMKRLEMSEPCDRKQKLLS